MSRNRSVVAITGVSSGICRELSKVFLSLGHKVAGCDVNSKGIKSLSEANKNDFLHLSTVDVSSDKQVEKWSKQVVDTLGCPDFIINGAAVLNEGKKVWEFTAEEFDRIIDSNIKGLANITRHFMPEIIKTNHPAVFINFTSHVVKDLCPTYVPYSASKAATNVFSLILAKELPSFVTCTQIDPGAVFTNMCYVRKPEGVTRTQLDEFMAEMIKPEEFARHVAPFIININRSKNGQVIHIPDTLGIGCNAKMVDGGRFSFEPVTKKNNLNTS